MADSTGVQPSLPDDHSTAIATPPAPADAVVGDPPFQPYVAASVRNMPEFTLQAVLVGAVLGIVFGASSLYLVLKVGLTVSASIPVAVLSITLFRVFSRVLRVRTATILENNIVQTTGSAGESIAFGVGVTMPALMLLGFEMSVGRVLVVSVLGGLLGVLMMIPLRRAFIVKQHGHLKYPEGTACAEVLIAGEKGGSTARTVFVGFGIAFVYEVFRSGLKWFQDSPEKSLKFIDKGLARMVPAIEVNPALLGVGYIIGTRISAIMCAGGILSAFVLIPLIGYFGDDLPWYLYPGDQLVGKMEPEDIARNFVLYIGAGAVAAGGIISVFRALPLIVSSIISGVRDLRATGFGAAGPSRTNHDMPLALVGVGSVALVGAIWSTTWLHREIPQVPDLGMNVVGAILIVVFGFLFVTVSSRLTGEIGSSSNPISGMTVGTLLLTCLIFVLLGWTTPDDRLTALTVAAVVCIAASNGGTTSQDLKTGYLIGATPRPQQWAILVGALTSALVIGFILIWLNDAYTVYTAKNLPTPEKPISMNEVKERGDRGRAPNDDKEYWVWRAREGNEQKVKPGHYLVDDEGTIHYLVDPGINGDRKQRDDGTEVPRFKSPKARLMALITDGILLGKLPWALVLIGVAIAVVLEMCGVSALAFAVGVYLPLSASAPILAGGIVRWIVDRARKRTAAATDPSGTPTDPPQADDSDSSPGALLATGYIAGAAIGGVLIAFLSFSQDIPRIMHFWEYRSLSTEKDQRIDDAFDAVARRELGIGEKPKDPEAAEDEALTAKVEALTDAMGELAGNEKLTTRYWPVPAGFTLKLPGNKDMVVEKASNLGDLAKDNLGSVEQADLLLTLNKDTLVRVKKSTDLKLPRKRNFEGEKEVVEVWDVKFEFDKEVIAVWDPKEKRFVVKDLTWTAPEEMTLSDAAGKALGNKDRAQELFELNKKELTPKVELPAGTPVYLPQSQWPALTAFGGLIVFQILVGAGMLLREKVLQPNLAASGR